MALVVLASVAWGIGASGCGVTPPSPGKYFDRYTPMSALLGFAYAVEIGEWDYAFASLAEESQKQVETPFRLRVAASFMDEPTTGFSVRDLIVHSIEWRTEQDPRVSDLPANVRAVQLWYQVPDEDGELYPEIIFDVFLVDESGEWKIDLGSTVQLNWGQVEASEVAAGD